MIKVFITFEAQIFEIVNPLGVYQFDVIVDRSTVVLAQVALGRDVIVFGRPTNKPPLQWH